MAYSLITEIAKEIAEFTGYTLKVKRSNIDLTLNNNLSDMGKDGKMPIKQNIALTDIWYGINWYIQTGRASSQIEQEINSLSGYQVIRLIAKMYLDGVSVSGDVGNWLTKYQGSYVKLISR